MAAPTTERPKSGSWERPVASISALDGLRAIAIVLVVVRHGVNPFWSEDEGLYSIAGYDIGTVMHNGWMGVDLFFVLSGFLITLHIVRRYGDGFGISNVGDYVRRRAFRIVPAYVASIVIAVSGLIPYFEIPRDALFLRVVYHLLFLQDYLPANIVVVYWSLGVEEKFYLFAPFVLIGVLRLSSRYLRYGSVLALALLPTLFRTLKYVNGETVDNYTAFFNEFRSPFHLTFDGLVLGVLAALIYIDRDQLAWTKNGRLVDALTWSGIVSFGGMLAHHRLMLEISWFNQTLMQAAIAFSAAAVLLGLVLGGGPIRLLSGQYLFVIGKLSYAWYLMHLMVVPFSWEIATRFALSQAGRAIVFVPVYLVLSLGLAYGLHVAVERPFLALRDRKIRK